MNYKFIYLQIKIDWNSSKFNENYEKNFQLWNENWEQEPIDEELKSKIFQEAKSFFTNK